MQHMSCGIPPSDVMFGNFLIDSCADMFQIATVSDSTCRRHIQCDCT